MNRKASVVAALALTLVVVTALPALAVSKNGDAYSSVHRTSCNYSNQNPETYPDHSALFHCPGSPSGGGWIGDQDIYWNFPSATGLNRVATCDCSVTYYGDVRFLDVYWEKANGRVRVSCFACDVLVRSVSIAKP